MGRSSFELTKEFEEVLGMDFSKSFVNACNTLKDHGRMVYFVTTEGDLVQNLEAKVSPDLVSAELSFTETNYEGLLNGNVS